MFLIIQVSYLHISMHISIENCVVSCILHKSFHHMHYLQVCHCRILDAKGNIIVRCINLIY